MGLSDLDGRVVAGPSHRGRRLGGRGRPGGAISHGVGAGSGSRMVARAPRGDVAAEPNGRGRVLLEPVAGVLHIGERRPRGPIRSFPHDSGILPRMSIFSGWAPMCRGARSAHGRISTALSIEAFPHDSADPLATGPDRMCNTAPTGPLPHIEPGSTRPNITRTTSPPAQGVAHTLHTQRISAGTPARASWNRGVLHTQRISGDDLLKYARVPDMTPAAPGALA